MFTKIKDMIKLTKLFKQHNGGEFGLGCAQIHSNHYECSLEHILNMVNELKKDFPNIKDEDIKIQKYGGNRIKGITFVEVFFTTKVKIPEGYQEITQLEYIL